MESIGEKLLKELRESEELRHALAAEPVSEIFKSRELRLAAIRSLYRDLATKQDIKTVEERMTRIGEDVNTLRERMTRLEGTLSQLVERIGDLDKRIDTLDKRIDYVYKATLILTGSVIATLIANIWLLEDKARESLGQRTHEHSV